MNAFEKKSFRYEILGRIAENLKDREAYYQTVLRDSEGHPVEDENGNWQYINPEDGYNKERLAVLREIESEFEKWALK